MKPEDFVQTTLNFFIEDCKVRLEKNSRLAVHYHQQVDQAKATLVEIQEESKKITERLAMLEKMVFGDKTEG